MACITGTHFSYDDSITTRLRNLDEKMNDMWGKNELDIQQLRRIHQQSKIDELYHSNRIEGNSLTYGETREVVNKGGHVYGKPIRHQQEARNLSATLDFVQELALASIRPITQANIREIHALVLNGIQDDAGAYRLSEIQIRGSKHSMPEALVVPQQMMDLGDYVSDITSLECNSVFDLPILCAAAAHTWLVQIHPFTDGNGRTARALLNLILMRKGYLPCIITEDDRDRYIDAMEYSRDASDLTPFAELVFENVREHLSSQEWLQALTARLEKSDASLAHEEYQTWHNSMQYLKSRFKHILDNVNAFRSTARIRCNFRDYGALSLEKYVTLRGGDNAKKTWFFGIELSNPTRRARYVFFFARSQGAMRGRSPAVLVVAKNSDEGYQSLFNLSKNGESVPDIFQVGFDLHARKFVTVGKAGLRERNPVNLVQQFVEQVIERDFAT